MENTTFLKQAPEVGCEYECATSTKGKDVSMENFTFLKQAPEVGCECECVPSTHGKEEKNTFLKQAQGKRCGETGIWKPKSRN